MSKRFKIVSICFFMLCALIALWYVIVYRVPYLTVQGLCQGNLRGIYLALGAYYDKNQAYPRSLEELISEGRLTNLGSQCPFQNHSTVRGIEYLYIPGLKKTDPSDWIWVFDRAENHPDMSINVLLISGKVITLTESEFDKQYRNFLKEFESQRGYLPSIVEDR